jgi:hypothetical protein
MRDDIRGDVGVRREDAIRQAENGVKPEVGEQFRFDPRCHAIGGKRAIRDDDSSAGGPSCGPFSRRAS